MVLGFSPASDTCIQNISNQGDSRTTLPGLMSVTPSVFFVGTEVIRVNRHMQACRPQFGSERLHAEGSIQEEDRPFTRLRSGSLLRSHGFQTEVVCQLRDRIASAVSVVNGGRRDSRTGNDRPTAGDPWIDDDQLGLIFSRSCFGVSRVRRGLDPKTQLRSVVSAVHR